MDEKDMFENASFADLASKYLEDGEKADAAAPSISDESAIAPPKSISAPIRTPKEKEQGSAVYFSNQFQPVQETPVPRRQGAPASVSSINTLNIDNAAFESASYEPEPNLERERYHQKRENRRKYLKKAKGKLRINFDPAKFTKNTYIFFAVVIALSIVVSVYAVFCVNDVLALTKSKEGTSVSVSENDVKNVNSVINVLHDNKLINCPLFCKVFVRVRSTMFVKYSSGEPVEYTQGTFDLNPKMGLEGLLVTLQGEVAEKETIQLTFPEGYTVPQIIKKLVDNQVCDEAALKAELEKAQFTYSILKDMTTSEQIPYKFEGYLFPDTYEFYQGENPNSVIEKFVKALDQNFTQEMRQRAADLNMTIPQVMTLASIIQQEAANKDQMKTISSILHNRLNNPQTYPLLQCNSTSDYINNKVAPSLTATAAHTGDYYLSYYDTYYSVQGLPAGAIANPGMDAIEAALNPDATDYFYFCHDKDRKMYVAKTLAEQNANIAKYNVNTTGK